jgi:serine/threonine protein kinase
MTTTIDRYEILNTIGSGGMATVYRAHDPRFGREVALKVMSADFAHNPTFAQRFEREARTIATLEHPAITPVYDFGEHEGCPFLVMRYMSEGSLANRIRHTPRVFSFSEK